MRIFSNAAHFIIILLLVACFQANAVQPRCELILAPYTYISSHTRADTYVVDGGPPTMSGRLHIGHVTVYVPVDILARYQRMNGKTVFYPMGWDTNGEPTMNKIEKDLGVKITRENRDKAAELCNQLVCLEEKHLWEIFDQIGLGLDRKLNYHTFDENHRLQTQMLFVEMLAKNQVRVTTEDQAQTLHYPTNEIERSLNFFDADNNPAPLWYVPTVELKKEMENLASQVQIQGLAKTLQNSIKKNDRNWVISRSRHYGIPIPVWYPLLADGSVDYKSPIAPATEQLPVDPTRATPPGYEESMRGIPGGFVSENNVLDTWFTSSATYLIQSRIHGNSELASADIRTHGEDISAAWSLKSLAQAYLNLPTLVPFNNLIIHGNISDSQGQKMSKSVGNVVNPMDLINEYGGDAVRFWAATVASQAPRLEPSKFIEGRRLGDMIFNNAQALAAVINSSKSFSQLSLKDVTHEVDRAYLNHLQDVANEMHRLLQANDYKGAMLYLAKDFTDFGITYLKTSVPYLAKNPDYKHARSMLYGTYSALTLYLKLFAPFMPFVAEEAGKILRHPSLHSEQWPPEAPHPYSEIDDSGVLNVFFRQFSTQRSLKADITSIKLKGNPSTIEKVSSAFREFQIIDYLGFPELQLEITESYSDNEVEFLFVEKIAGSEKEKKLRLRF